MPRWTATAEERFFQNVERVTESGCWIWTGSLIGRDHRPRFWVVNKHVYAHRFAFAHFVAPFDESLKVCHRCDVPACVNPAHLFIGTQSDNIQDMHAKGRGRPSLGSKNHLSKLTEDDVRAIRARYIPRHPQNGLEVMAREFGVRPNTLYSLLARDTWKHI